MTINAKACTTTAQRIPPWASMARRITEDLTTNKMLEGFVVTAETSAKDLHRLLPKGPENINTTLYREGEVSVRKKAVSAFR